MTHIERCFSLRDELNTWVARHEHLITSGQAANILARMRVPITLSAPPVSNGAVANETAQQLVDTTSTKRRNHLRRLMQDNQKLKQLSIAELVCNPCRSWSRHAPPPPASASDVMTAIGDAVQRRLDTFDRVSLKDYVLLPATVINGTILRPRIALIVPAALHNATMTMMRIECEVTATSTFDLDPMLIQ